MTPTTRQRPALSGPRRVDGLELIGAPAALAALAAPSVPSPPSPATVPLIADAGISVSPPTVPMPRRPQPETQAETQPELAAAPEAEAPLETEAEPLPPAPAVRRDRVALRDRAVLRERTTPGRSTRTRRPALRGRKPMRDRVPRRDRAALRGRPEAPEQATGPAIIRHHNEPRPRRRRRWVRVVGLVVLLASAAVAWGGYQVRSAQSSLTAARAETAAVQRQLVTYQWSDAGAGLTRARLHAQAASQVTDGRVWQLAAHLPRFGRDVTAIGQVADTMNRLTRATRPLETVLPEITVLGGTTTAGLIGSTGPNNLGDVAALQNVVAILPSVSTTLAASQSELAGAPSSGLTASTRAGLAGTRKVVDSLRRTAGSAAPVLSVLPAMLGASGQRTWLVELEQPAVAGQPSGGRIGAYAIVRAGHGKLDVVETHRRPAARTSAGLVRALQQRVGGAPDYVLVLDTPALAALVQATGPTQLGNTTIDGASTQRFLTQDILARHHSTAWTDTVAAVVLSRSLTKLGAGQVDWPQLIRSLGAPVGAGQVQLWAGDEKVQQQLLALSVAAGPDAGEAARIARVVTSARTPTTRAVATGQAPRPGLNR